MWPSEKQEERQEKRRALVGKQSGDKQCPKQDLVADSPDHEYHQKHSGRVRR